MKIIKPAQGWPPRGSPLGLAGNPMQDSVANPVVVVLLFLARCLVPVGLLLGFSYLLRRLGLVQGPPPPPNKPDNSQTSNEGMQHGRP